MKKKTQNIKTMGDSKKKAEKVKNKGVFSPNFRPAFPRKSRPGRKKKFFFFQWLLRTKVSLKLLVLDNFFLMLYFLFFIVLSIKNKKQNYGILKLFLSLKNHIYLVVLKRLTLLKSVFFFNPLYSYLIFQITKKWNNFLLKNISKKIFRILNFKQGLFRDFFLVYLKKILKFLVNTKAVFLLSFISSKINGWLFRLGKFFIAKGLFSERSLSRTFQKFYWQFSPKSRYFFSHMLLWIYFIFDKITFVYWLAFFFFWLRNFIFLLFGLNWLWITSKDDIFKAFEYSRNITISFNYNVFVQDFHALDYDTAFLKIFNRVKGISCQFNFLYYTKNVLEDWDVFNSFYFFQDKGLNFFLKMQQDVLAFNAFLDRFLKKMVQPGVPGDSSRFFPYFLDFQLVKPNLKNFWFLDSSQDQGNFLFFFKPLLTQFFFLKKQKIFFVPSFFSDSFFLETAVSKFLSKSLQNTKTYPIFFFVKRFFFERFFLFFLDKFIFFSYFFFQHFFLYNFFFKFVKFITVCFFNFFNLFFLKMHSSQHRFIYFYFCLFLKDYFRQQQFSDFSSGFFFDSLSLNYNSMAIPNLGLTQSNFFLGTFLKSFSFFQDNYSNKSFFLNSGKVIRKISKKFLFWEIFLKKELFRYLKEKSTLPQMPVLLFFSSLRFKRLRSLFLFFIAFQEARVFRKKASKTLADFTMENFLAFDIFSLSSFFFKSLSAPFSLPLVFWNHFKFTFFSFFQAKSFFYLQKLLKKALKTFIHFFFFLQKELVGNYLVSLKKASRTFLKAAAFLKQLKVRLAYKQNFFNFFPSSFSFFHSDFFSGIARSRSRSKDFFSFLLTSLKFPSFFSNKLFKKGSCFFFRDALAPTFPFFNAPGFFINPFQVQRFFTQKFFLKKKSFSKFLKKAYSVKSPFFFKQWFTAKTSSAFFSFSKFFLKKQLFQSFTRSPYKSFKRLSLSTFFNKKKNFYFFSGFRSSTSSEAFSLLRLIRFARFIRALKRNKAKAVEYIFRQKRILKKNVLGSYASKSSALYSNTIFSKVMQLQNSLKNFQGSQKFFNYKSYGLFFHSFFLQSLQKKKAKVVHSFKTYLCFKKLSASPGCSNFSLAFDFISFKNFFSNFLHKKSFFFFSSGVAKTLKIPYFLQFFFKTFLRKLFFLPGSFSFAARPFLNFFFSSFPFLKQSRKTFFFYFPSLLKTFFFGDFFFLPRSLFYFDFFSTFGDSQDIFFFNFFSVKSFLKKSSLKKIFGARIYSRKRKPSWKMPFANSNCFIFKSKGFLFFLRKFEVLLFLDDFYIWYFCFRTRIIKKRLVFGSSRVFFFKPFFFEKGNVKSFSFLQFLRSLPHGNRLAKSFHYLYNKTLIKQKSVFLRFYYINNNVVFFLDNFFWSLVSYKQLGFFFKTTFKPNSFQFFLLKKNCFFVPFFFKEKNFLFFFALPAFLQKISLRISLYFLKPQQGAFLALNQFFFMNYSKPVFLKQRLIKNFSLQSFTKRISFLKKVLNPFLKQSFHFLKWLRLYRTLRFSDLSLWNWKHFYLYDFWKKDMDTRWGAKIFVRNKNRTLLVLKPSRRRLKKQGFQSRIQSSYSFFLHYFYHYRSHLHKHSLVFFQYLNHLLQKFDLQLQKDFFFSFIRFFWKDGRKFWYFKVAKEYYVWDFEKKTWFLYQKPSLFNFFFSPPSLAKQHAIFISRIHFKIFNSSVFNQFFSFSFIKRWTSWKFLYRMEDFLSQLSIQRSFIRRGLSLNYRGITLTNSYFGTSFFLNNRSFYSFNSLLLKSLLYNVKSVFFFNLHNIFSREILSKLFKQKTFFALYSFFPLLSKTIFKNFTHFKNFTQSFFFFSNFSFFVRSSVQGFFWNYLSFINPFIRMKKYALGFKSKFFATPFCNFLFLDFKEHFFYSKFFGSRINALWRQGAKVSN